MSQKPAKKAKHSKALSTGRWSQEETDLIKRLLKDNPGINGDQLHVHFPDKQLKSVKAKLQYLRGGSLSTSINYFSRLSHLTFYLLLYRARS